MQRLPPACDLWLWCGGKTLKGFNEETPESSDGNLVGLVGIVCICICAFATPVDCQRAETVRPKHHPSLLSSHLHQCLSLPAIARWLLCMLQNV